MTRHHQGHSQTLGPSPPFVQPFMGGAPLLSTNFQGLRRFGVGGLAIMKNFFSQFVPKPMSRYEMLELAWRLRKAAERIHPPQGSGGRAR